MRASITVKAALLLLAAVPLVAASILSARADEPGATDRQSLRVVTYNLYNRPWERGIRLKNALKVIEQASADVVALQEVATGWVLPGPDAFSSFRDTLGFDGRRHFHDGTPFFKSGVALFSRYPIIRDDYHEFADSRVIDRKGFQFTKIDAPIGELGVINLHMTSGATDAIRAGEFRQLRDFVKSLKAELPVLILGDFNTVPSNPEFQRLLSELDAKPSYEKMKATRNTWSSGYALGCGRPGAGEWIDHVVVVGAKGVRASWAASEVLEPELVPHPSDHCPVTGEVVFERVAAKP